ncbi:superoxide dismutase, Ni [Candidatus Peregrinibacteria bacterium CG_4_9_14_0_2_um_filter_53_11]|nr:MAG: superoxide dismutase, Ni [Candidatus Peregrinibacteria bacterium CG_4_9_14_0_2_um_filter_53_11]
MNTLLSFLNNSIKPTPAHAHCDVPCGVYEVDSMSWAVETCMKLVDKLAALEEPAHDDQAHRLEYHNTVTRAVMVKEEYAQICKEQVLILWTDYFKPEHLEKWPNLHDLVWKTTKQCSVVKRTVDLAEVKKLHDLVHEVADIFKATKQA